MELLDLVKETKALEEDIKRQRREFNSKIKEEVMIHKSKKNEIEKYLKETINSREYEYREVEIESFSFFGKGKIKTYYPFLKFEDIYELRELEFRNDEDSDDDGITRKYILYNKINGMEIKVEEHSMIHRYEKGTNQVWKHHFDFGEEIIIASKYLSYEIEIEGMKFKFRREFDVSKI